GGEAALEVARDGKDLVAAISFHGLLATPLHARAGVVKARLLVLHGDADPMVPREQVAGFMAEMDHAKANWHLHVYSGVRHGFTDLASDLRDLDAVAYDASADRQSWAASMAFLDEVLEP
ncbi:MAG: dienelactone hydrolase family protein, partial [Alphaproteobacteria bacterium]|nr:dienelactone hydrolase family protein [Alphaproteobacteria bacterium]